MVNHEPALYPASDVDSSVNGKYVIERRLGGGGMAEVFLARTVGAEGFSRAVAIKRVLAGFSQNPQFAKFFVSEAQLTSRLQHPNIVSVLDFDRDREGRLFLVMELVDGTDLDGLLGTGPLPFPVVIYLATEILRGLDHAHELLASGDHVRGVVHRDISPHNVLLSWTGAVKVSDFGIAKARAASNASASVTIKGKPAYMSPEQAEGKPLDGRSDLFSVGVMLFEMVCLQHLFAAETTTGTIARLLNAPIPAPRDVRPEVPEDLSRVILSLLARNREKRVPSANAALAALVACADYPRDGREALVTTLAQRFVGRAPARRAAVSSPNRRDAHQPFVALPPGARTLTPFSGLRFSDRRRWPWVLLAMLVAASAVVGVMIVNSRSSRLTAVAPPAAAEATSKPSATTSPPAAGSAVPEAASTPPPPAPREAAAGPGSSASPSPTSPAKASGPAPEQDRSPPQRAPVRPAHHPEQPKGIREIRL